MTKKTIGVGVIGVGFMGRTHIGAWKAVADTLSGCRLVAVADRNATRRAGLPESTGNSVAETKTAQLFDPETTRGYETAAELLADAEVDAVSLCTPTDTHVDLAIAALAAGKHVLVEKPVALRSEDVARLRHAARHSNRVCMPAHCIRFWPAWAWLEESIRSGAFGALRSLSIERLGDVPTWSKHFYDNPARSGGALIDLHIHDADFVRFTCGDPIAVSSCGDANHVTTVYRFDDDGPQHVVATGGWIPGVSFRMNYLAAFEDATVEYRFGHAMDLTILRSGEDPQPVNVDARDGYYHQTAHFLDCIQGGKEPAVTIDDAEAVARVLDAERRSQLVGRQISLLDLA